jgi:hypothetical protein
MPVSGHQEKLEFFELLLSACGISFRRINPCGSKAPYLFYGQVAGQ